MLIGIIFFKIDNIIEMYWPIKLETVNFIFFQGSLSVYIQFEIARAKAML